MSYFFLAILIFIGGNLLFGWLFGGTGSFIFTMLLVGFVGYQYGAIRELRSRMEELEQRAGLMPDPDDSMSNEEIEEELEQYIEPPGNRTSL